jgi:multicomponent Na+:H+ antiporter subunit F
MQTFLLVAVTLLMVVIVIPLVRVWKGPTVFDRLLGANAMATKTIVLIAMIGYFYDRIGMFIDITLAYAALGFISSLALAKYMTAEAQPEDAQQGVAQPGVAQHETAQPDPAQKEEQDG